MCKEVFNKICANADECLKKYKEWDDEKQILCKKENTSFDCGCCVAVGMDLMLPGWEYYRI